MHNVSRSSLRYVRIDPLRLRRLGVRPGSRNRQPIRHEKVVRGEEGTNEESKYRFSTFLTRTKKEERSVAFHILTFSFFVNLSAVNTKSVTQNKLINNEDIGLISRSLTPYSQFVGLFTSYGRKIDASTKYRPKGYLREDELPSHWNWTCCT